MSLQWLDSSGWSILAWLAFQVERAHPGLVAVQLAVSRIIMAWFIFFAWRGFLERFTASKALRSAAWHDLEKHKVATPVRNDTG